MKKVYHQQSYRINKQTITFASKNLKTLITKINIELEVIGIMQPSIEVLHIAYVI